jgi:hypothetical protein
MWQVWEKLKLHAGLWWGNPQESDHLKNLGVDESFILKRLLQE